MYVNTRSDPHLANGTSLYPHVVLDPQPGEIVHVEGNFDGVEISVDCHLIGPATFKNLKINCADVRLTGVDVNGLIVTGVSHVEIYQSKVQKVSSVICLGGWQRFIFRNCLILGDSVITDGITWRVENCVVENELYVAKGGLCEAYNSYFVNAVLGNITLFNSVMGEGK